jgi:hypothetical protein
VEEVEVDEGTEVQPGGETGDGTGATPPSEPGAEDHPQPSGSEGPTSPAVEELRQGEFLIWSRWKGSLLDIAKVFRLAEDLIGQAVAGQPAEPYSSGGTYTVKLRGRERSFRDLKALEVEIPDLELDSVQGLSMYRWTAKVSVSISVDGSSGSYLSVRGQDRFAVAGVEAELKTAMNRGRRWSQVGGWPGVVEFWAPWVAILGLSLVTLSGSDLIDSLGKVALAVAACLFAVVLFLRYVEPRLVPPLELLSDSQPRTVAQVWKGRLLKVLGFAAVGIAGAVINGLTGFLF